MSVRVVSGLDNNNRKLFECFDEDLPKTAFVPTTALSEHTINHGPWSYGPWKINVMSAKLVANEAKKKSGTFRSRYEYDNEYHFWNVSRIRVTPISLPGPIFLLVSHREERGLWERHCFESRKSYSFSYLNLKVPINSPTKRNSLCKIVTVILKKVWIKQIEIEIEILHVPYNAERFRILRLTKEHFLYTCYTMPNVLE